MPNSSRPLLMIPGPVEISAAVRAAAALPPLSHLDPELIAAFGSALRGLRAIWLAPPGSQPFVVPGSGTLAMESAVANLVAPGDRTLVIVTGYFGDRMVEMLRRKGAEVAALVRSPGDAPPLDEIEGALERAVLARKPFKAIFATHVDTSTAVRLDPEPIARLARRHGALSVFDGVCATGGERFDMARFGADLYFTASQKALGLPAGLALWVAAPHALAARRALPAPPPLALDWEAWRPVMESYEAGKGAYFATPPTTLVRALAAGVEELLGDATGASAPAAVAAAWTRHERAASALRAAWDALGLQPLPVRHTLAANTLSALRYPAGVGPELVAAIRAQGVIVAGGLHRELAASYFRVGHMGEVTRRPALLSRAVRAIAAAVGGARSETVRAAEGAFRASWDSAER